MGTEPKHNDRIVNADAETMPGLAESLRRLVGMLAESGASAELTAYPEAEEMPDSVLAEAVRIMSNVQIIAPRPGDTEQYEGILGRDICVVINFKPLEGAAGSSVSIFVHDRIGDAPGKTKYRLNDLSVVLVPEESGSQPLTELFENTYYFERLTPGEKYRVEVSALRSAASS